MAITQARLQQLLDYNPLTGIFVWKVTRGKIRAGSIAGTFNMGYMQIRIDYKIHKAHRLAWLYTTGETPVGEIDHINGDKIDNRIVNLRVVTSRQNNSNRRCHREGHLVGTSLRKDLDRWVAHISINGRLKHIGFYDTQLEAHEAYQAYKALHII